jgi:hypothetical protein
MLHCTDDIIIALFCSIEDKLEYEDYIHPQAKLWLSEIMTIGCLWLLKGKSFRQFYQWLCREEFFTLPERSRLMRLLNRNKETCRKFLSEPTVLNVTDSMGVEVIHPIRENRSEQSKKVSKKGKSNHRWIVGRKITPVINSDLEIVNYTDDTDNVPDKTFNEMIKTILGIVLADMGFRDKNGIPENMKICEKGKWGDRMLIETLNSLWVRVCQIKRSFHRSVNGFKAKIAYMMMLTNIVFQSNESLGYKKFSMVQWAL